MKKFRNDLISTLSEDQVKEYGINLEEEKEKANRDKEKRDYIEREYKKALKKEDYKQRGLDPNLVDQEEEEEQEEEEDDEDDTTFTVLTALGAVAAVGVGLFYFLGKKNQ